MTHTTRDGLMAGFSIAFNGRHYLFGQYRYDHLADAVNYATLQRAKGRGADSIGPMPAWQQVEGPSEAERELMSTLAITFQDGIYHLRAYRYDRLADAVDYARLQKIGNKLR